MANGYDERCANDLASVRENRQLSRDNACWLARAVIGAIRPNRDKPLWDMAHAVVAIGAKGRAPAVLDIVLDSRLATPEAIAQHLSSIVPPERCDERGLLLRAGDTLWKGSWTGLVQLLALAEFILTMEEFAGFREVSGWLDEALAPPHDVDLLVSRLVRRINLYRRAHVPLAPVEKRFRAILEFLSKSRGRDGARDTFDDDDIQAFWRTRITAGGRPQFRTIVDHFITFEKATKTLGSLRSIAEAMSLEAIEDWAARLEAKLGDLTTSDDAEVSLAEGLAAIPKSPNILKRTERKHLIDVLSLDPFHRTRPLTVLRTVSFGRVQSGIANWLRRRGGGSPIEERVRCANAESYADVLARAKVLKEHLDRMIGIATALRFRDMNFDDPAVAERLADWLADIGHIYGQNVTAGDLRKQVADWLDDIRNIRRKGFDRDREELGAAFAKVDEALISVRDEIERFMSSAAKPVKGRLPTDRFPEDRTFFSDAFTDAYVHKAPWSDADDDEAG
jgi:hypothetical protein